MLSQPPYTLATTPFRFRALSALAGRLPLGGERELAMAVFVAARLASGGLPPYALLGDVRRTRVSGMRPWIGALTLPAAARSAMTALAEASARDDRTSIATALDRITTLATPILDAASRAELQQLGKALRTS